MSWTRATLAALVVAAVPSATACGKILCTELTCVDGFAVVLLGDVPNDYTIRLEPSGGTPVEFTNGCRELDCPHTWTIEGSRPGQVEVVVFDSQGMEIARESFQAVYEDFRPNGSECPPTCLQAIHTVTIT